MPAGVITETVFSFRRRFITVLAAALLIFLSRIAPAALTRAAPGQLGLDAQRLARIDAVMAAGIKAGDFPGAVVVIGRHGRIAFERAYGVRQTKPKPVPMTVDTVFDLASLTKIVATAPSIMQLVEDGRLRLDGHLGDLIPACDRKDKRDITVRQLLEHDSGLRPGFDRATLHRIHGYEDGVRLACRSKPFARPGKEFRYSDLNYLLLAEVVRRVSSQRLDDYVAARLFKPLGMNDTGFHPPASLMPRIAPTDAGTGRVADGIARRMDGVSGNAGVFGSAGDLAIYCTMLLNGGQWNGVRVLSPLAVRRMTTPATTHPDGVRGLGFDIDTAYSGARGDLFPFGSFGHTGYTGTSIWLDPGTDTFVVILTSRLYPHGKGDVRDLRSEIASIAASAIVDIPPRTAARKDQIVQGGKAADLPSVPVMTGIDVLRAEGFKSLRGHRIGLLTQRTMAASDGQSTVDVLRAAPDVKLVALFSPEHGFDGDGNGRIASGSDGTSGLPVYSLYGKTVRPTAQMLQGIDMLVIDLQDAGARFYTYMTTMAYAMEAAARLHIAVVVLDRPNPVNGDQIEGPLPDAAEPAFTSYYPMPVRHGLTLGELARLFNAEKHIGADLTVVPMRHWQRRMWFDDTGLRWVDPSPNLRSPLEASLYPGIGAIEGTRISVGRGTDAPFEQLGAPWIDGMKLARYLNDRHLPGVRFYPRSFTPTVAPYRDRLCQGVGISLLDRDAFLPVRTGLEIAAALNRLFKADYGLAREKRLLGSQRILERVLAGDDPAQIAEGYAAADARWRAQRAPYLLYP